MKKTLILVFIAVIAITVFGTCKKNRSSIEVHNAKISIDWDGVYTGTIPSASGSGINVRMKLTMDEYYELSYEYLDKPENSFTWTGSFTWDDKGEIITIDAADVPRYYKVAENKLIQLDMQGNPITGNLADNYVLKKER